MHLVLDQGSLKAVSLKFDQSRYVWLQVKLSRSEFVILEELVNNLGQHLTKTHLLKIGWPNYYVCDNSLNMVIMSLRKKLECLGGHIEIITIHRVGYSLNTVSNSC
ncbi:helix-turn-helix domain-containing protein [Vibrio chagasii]|uniref:helix-turn-helix domain-containing protein n=1 Tax=Vibrio chagasii TaxID=170679 RepID=UPI004068D8DD